MSDSTRVERDANFATGGFWVLRVMLGLLTVIDVSTVPKRDEFKEAIALVFRTADGGLQRPAHAVSAIS
ncbi:MAG TPA: hypothetical protein VFA66_09570 [Gaiellaceae bacterium]|nr:hypothetical protein [Gaiellaceae bacterium]